MKVTLNTNIASMGAQRQLSRIQTEMTRVFERLSTGLRIAGPGDDPAGLSVAEQLKVNAKVLNQGIRNLNDGISLLNVADSAIGQLTDIVTRISELAEQGASGGLGRDQRIALDKEAQALSKEFSRIVQSTEYNGLNLLDGTLGSGISLQAGYGEQAILFEGVGGEIGTGELEASQSSAVIGSNYNVLTADFNHDGILDAVTTNSGASVTVSLGLGDGTFGTAQTYASLGVAGEIATSDFNGDGIIDIAASDGSSVSVLLGSGDGTFAVGNSAFSLGVGLTEMTVGDFNNDGIQDIASTSFTGGEIGVILGIGDGTFSSAQSYTVGLQPTRLISTDFNNDGILDLAAAALNDDEVRILLGNGDGSFGAPLTAANVTGVEIVKSGDLNGDGIEDLVAGTNQANNTLSIMFGNGDGTFGAVQTLAAAGTDLIDLELVDLDQDGVLDIVTASYTANAIGVNLGIGDGTFEAAEQYDVGDFPDDIVTGDFNNDGVPDILASVAATTTIDTFLGVTEQGTGTIIPFSLKTQADSIQALAPLRNKLNLLNQQRGELGAFQSRITAATGALQAMSVESTAAESRIRDADIATETSNLVRLQILQQAAAAVLGQANQQPSIAIQLISGE